MKGPSGNDSANKKTKKESAADWIKNIDPNKVMGDAQHLLKKAVDVLEEEIAAGILVAKKLEKKVINVDEVRDTNPEELMSRIRRDTHDAVDILLDAFTALTSHFGSLTSTLNKTRPDPAAQNEAKPQNNGKSQNGTRQNGTQQNGSRQNTVPPVIPVIKAGKRAKPGDTIEVPIELTNDSNQQSITIVLNKSELVGPGGSKIPARFIKLAPKTFTLDPLHKKEVMIKISIPDSCKPGIYSGLIQDDINPDLRVILAIEIEQIEM